MSYTHEKKKPIARVVLVSDVRLRYINLLIYK